MSFEYADRLMTGLSHDYEVAYFDGDVLCSCTYHPGETLAECSLEGWPDDDRLQQIVIDRLKIAVAQDADDCHLVLSSDELSAVEGLEYGTLADRQPEDFDIGSFAEMAEADDEDSRREIIAAALRLGKYGAMFGRNGLGEMVNELQTMIAGDPDEFDVRRASEIVGALEATACGY